MEAMPRGFWLRIRPEVASGSGYRITRAGAYYLLTVVVVALAAFLSGNNLLFLLLAAMLATLVISGFVSRLNLAGLELDFHLPEHITARRPVGARISVRNAKWLVPSFSVHLSGIPPSVFSAGLYLAMIPARSRVEETVSVTFGRRGVHQEKSFRFSTRFPFGFTERWFHVRLLRQALVYPCLEPQPGFEELAGQVRGELEARRRGRGHDFYRIRPYEPLESARHVDWKATAHTGELQVREFAREQEPLVEIVLDLEAGPAELDWFEQAVECCAYLCWRMLWREARVRFRTQEFEVAVPAEGDVYTILKYLALVAPQPGKGAIEPRDEDGYSVVFTSHRERFEPPIWQGALVLGPDSPLFERRRADADRTGAHVDHRGREAGGGDAGAGDGERSGGARQGPRRQS
jgi:uncharacterized protein (DUF58 family)